MGPTSHYRSNPLSRHAISVLARQVQTGLPTHRDLNIDDDDLSPGETAAVQPAAPQPPYDWAAANQQKKDAIAQLASLSTTIDDIGQEQRTGPTDPKPRTRLDPARSAVSPDRATHRTGVTGPLTTDQRPVPVVRARFGLRTAARTLITEPTVFGGVTAAVRADVVDAALILMGSVVPRCCWGTAMLSTLPLHHRPRAQDP